MIKSATDKPNGRQPAWTQAYVDLRKRILACTLAPGTAISEQSLAKQYGMSPTPVRDALSRLRQEGLVTQRSGGGFEVAPLMFADIRQLAELRWAIETGIISLAIERAEPEHVEQLRPLAMAGREPLSGPERIAINRQFHLAVAALTGNARLVSALSQVLDASERFFHLGIDGLSPNQMGDTHLSILEAIADKHLGRAHDLCAQEAFGNSERVIRALVERAVRPNGQTGVWSGLMLGSPQTS